MEIWFKSNLNLRKINTFIFTTLVVNLMVVFNLRKYEVLKSIYISRFKVI